MRSCECGRRVMLRPVVLNMWSQPAAPAAPGNLFKIQILRIVPECVLRGPPGDAHQSLRITVSRRRCYGVEKGVERHIGYLSSRDSGRAFILRIPYICIVIYSVLSHLIFTTTGHETEKGVQKV